MTTDYARTRQDHQRITEEVSKWPMWPILPMKRIQNGNLETGIITPDYPSTIIHVNLFQTDLIAVTIRQLKSDGEVDGCKTTKYQDVWAMLDDGWKVD